MQGAVSSPSVAGRRLYVARKARQAHYDGQTKYSEIESAAIARQLAEAGLKIWEVPSDGDCLFHSLAHQLKLADSKNPI